MSRNRSLYIPVILGTPRQGRLSEHVANLVVTEVAKHPGVETTLLDVRTIRLPSLGEGEEIKDVQFSSECDRADAFAIVAPEYNHGYPGTLKRVLDTNLKEYIHKAVGIVGVSAGPFGGTRVIQNLLPVMRELGLVTIFWDGNFSRVHTCFDASGKLLDQSYLRRLEKFLTELIWMGTVLRYGRENVSLQ